jgi:hypothetical protein
MLNFDWLSEVSQEQAKNIFLIFFVLIGILVLLIPNDYAYEGVAKKNRHWYNNLKLWSVGSIAILFLIYCLF